jgi:hypothetical protein
VKLGRDEYLEAWKLGRGDYLEACEGIAILRLRLRHLLHACLSLEPLPLHIIILTY